MNSYIQERHAEVQQRLFKILALPNRNEESFAELMQLLSIQCFESNERVILGELLSYPEGIWVGTDTFSSMAQIDRSNQIALTLRGILQLNVTEKHYKKKLRHFCRLWIRSGMRGRSLADALLLSEKKWGLIFSDAIIGTLSVFSNSEMWTQTMLALAACSAKEIEMGYIKNVSRWKSLRVESAVGFLCWAQGGTLEATRKIFRKWFHATSVRHRGFVFDLWWLCERIGFELGAVYCEIALEMGDCRQCDILIPLVLKEPGTDYVPLVRQLQKMGDERVKAMAKITLETTSGDKV